LTSTFPFTNAHAESADVRRNALRLSVRGAKIH